MWRGEAVGALAAPPVFPLLRLSSPSPATAVSACRCSPARLPAHGHGVVGRAGPGRSGFCELCRRLWRGRPAAGRLSVGRSVGRSGRRRRRRAPEAGGTPRPTSAAAVERAGPTPVVPAARWLVLSRGSPRSYLVDPASSICLSQRLSHACLSTHGRYSETANGSLNQLWFLWSLAPLLLG